MKREARLLLEKAGDSLVLAIELFNRPYDRGRVSAALMHLDHSFEMFMKAAILHRGGTIREKRCKETIGFDACVRRSLSDGGLRYLTAEQALVLQAMNGLRDAAQHHLVDVSEGQLYIHMQSGVTLFRDLLRLVFGQELAAQLPARVLPVSTSPPTDLAILFDSETKEIRKLLRPGKRRQIEALARLRPLAILDATIRGEKVQPSDSELRRLGTSITEGRAWTEIFVGAAAIEMTTAGTGPSISLRIKKQEGNPICLVKEGTPGAAVVAVKRVDELGFYSLGAKALAEQVGVTTPKLVAIMAHIGLQKDPECYKEVRIGNSTFKRYSHHAVTAVKEALKAQSADEIWRARSAEIPRLKT
jgi:hypothetical protein